MRNLNTENNPGPSVTPPEQHSAQSLALPVTPEIPAPLVFIAALEPAAQQAQAPHATPRERALTAYHELTSSLREGFSGADFDRTLRTLERLDSNSFSILLSIHRQQTGESLITRLANTRFDSPPLLSAVVSAGSYLATGDTYNSVLQRVCQNLLAPTRTGEGRWKVRVVE